MDLSATQIYEDEGFAATQRILYTEEDELTQVGTLSINSIEYQIKRGITKIGRLASCDITISNPTVSKIHAEIEASTGQVSTWICDLHSSNKTKLNNLTLRPTRSYELKDGSVIGFGNVQAIYRAYHLTSDITNDKNDTVIPETPAPMRHGIASGKVIPNTPDSFLNNSSVVEDDGSVILRTQRDSVFRRPLLPSCQSVSTGKRDTCGASFTNESDNSQIDSGSLRVPDNDNSGVRGVSIHDMETQKFEGGREAVVVSSSVHDVETQKYSTDAFGHVDNITANKELSKLHYAAGGLPRDVETRDDAGGIAVSDARGATSRTSATDIHDLKSQDYVGVVAKVGESKVQTKGAIEHDIHDLETQQPDGIYHADMQLIIDQVKSKTIDRLADKLKDKNSDTLDVDRSGTSREDAAKSSSSRCSSPRSLNLSSPGVDEDCPSSPFNHSVHLLESSNLLEYFGDGLDKTGKLAATKASTPKPRSPKAKGRPRKDDEARSLINVPDSENDDEDNIFNVPTQRVNMEFETLLSGDSEIDEREGMFMKFKVSKKGFKQSRPKQTNDDSETDTEECWGELVRKQDEFLEAANKSLHGGSTESKNDPGTSAELDDVFDMPTQRPRICAAEGATNSSSVSQQRTSNKHKSNAVVGDTAPTQKKDIENRDERIDRSSSTDIDDMPTQRILPCEVFSKAAIDFKSFSTGINRSDVDDVATHIVNAIADASENLDCEDIDYEQAPTQVIGEVEKAKESTKRKLARDSEKPVVSAQVDLNDTLEQNLNEMFNGASCDDIHEAPHMSTQYLEDILQSSQRDNSSANKSVIYSDALTDSATETKSRKRSCASRDHQVSCSENNAANDSQDSDVYFSNMTTKRKRNVIRDTQEFATLTTPPCRSVKSRRKGKTDDAVMEVKREEAKRIRSKRNNSTTSDSTKYDDTVSKTTLSDGNKRGVRRSRLMKQKDGDARLETNERVAAENSYEVQIDDMERRLASSDSDVCTFCPSLNKQAAQMPNVTYESDDDILKHLPAVRISGTVSKSPSPSGSTMSISKSRQDTAKGSYQKDEPLSSKSLCWRGIEALRENPNLNINESLNADRSLNPGIPKTSKTSKIASTSENLNCEVNYKRFKQVVDGMLSNELSYVRSQIRNARGANKLVDRGGSTSPIISDALNESKQNRAETEGPEDPTQTNSKVTRRSSKRNNKHSCVFQVTKEARVKDTVDVSRRAEMKFAETKRKKGWRMSAEESTWKNNSKKRKVNVPEEQEVTARVRRNTMRIVSSRQSSNFEHIAKTNSFSNSLAIGYTRSSANDKAVLDEARRTSLNPKAAENVDIDKSNDKRSKHKVNDRPTAVRISDVITDENSNNGNSKNKHVSVKKKGKQSNQLQVNLIRIHTESTGEESQEVEMIMQNAQRNALEKSSPIERRDDARTSQRKLRSTKNRKRLNAIIEAQSILVENNASCKSNCSDSALSDNFALKAKRNKLTKSTVAPPKKFTISKREKFIKSARISQNSAHSVVNISAENFISEDSQDSVKTNVSWRSRLSRTKAVRTKKAEQIEVDRSTRRSKTSSEITMNAETVFLSSTPTKTNLRRSISSLNNSSLSTAKHKVLFTGITEDVYSKIVKMLGGVKVEDLATCTVLVTDKIRRTYKFLCALAQGVPIVTINWLRDSESAAQFLDWDNYILKDPAAEVKFGFRLRKSLEIAKKKKLLDGYTIVLTPNVVPPPVEELKDMVTSCGGKVLLRPPARWPEKAVIISREEDSPNAKKYLAKAPKTVTVQSTEFVLTGILRQEVEFDKYRLTV